jgi:4-hydroxy-tetrahydrodipicolinate reductase
MAEHSLQIAVLGVSGRMGRALLTAIDEAPGTKLGGASASSSSRWLGKDASDATGGPQRNVTVEADPAAALRNVQVAIDFTLPEATAANLAACVAARCPVVIGTTGHTEAVKAQIAAAAQSIPIVMAPNMSLGVNLLLKLVELAASKLDADYDIEVFEAHHRNKKDAPSGTALALGAAAADGRDVKLADAVEYSRHGNTGARKRGSIGFSVFRPHRDVRRHRRAHRIDASGQRSARLRARSGQSSPMARRSAAGSLLDAGRARPLNPAGTPNLGWRGQI